jgi:cellulose synthase/poly-beta-1,6-N-acetylglucosamine synthase-like glycosyltransferase
MAFYLVGLTLAIVCCVPAAMLFAECLAAGWPSRKSLRMEGPRPRIDIIIPAHNEASALPATLGSLLPQLEDGDRLSVIADNCTDDTAQVASLSGVRVIERHDLAHRGKGFALNFALNQIADDHRDVVIFIDADCQVGRDAIDRLARTAAASDRPVQAAYHMTRPANGRTSDLVSELAVTVKNVVRPQGMTRLGCPCLLTGSGMALPWHVLAACQLAGGHIVEDMQFSIDLAVAGYAPLFCPEAHVVAGLPGQREAVRTQRMRWEHGHLDTLWTQTPRLLVAAWRQKRLGLAAMALDVSIPPLSLLAMGWFLTVLVALSSAACQGWWAPTALAALSGVLLAGSIALAWKEVAPHGLSWQLLIAVPGYAVRKLPLYAAFLARRQRDWVRTAREPNPTPL